MGSVLRVKQNLFRDKKENEGKSLKAHLLAAEVSVVARDALPEAHAPELRRRDLDRLVVGARRLELLAQTVLVTACKNTVHKF